MILRYRAIPKQAERPGQVPGLPFRWEIAVSEYGFRVNNQKPYREIFRISEQGAAKGRSESEQVCEGEDQVNRRWSRDYVSQSQLYSRQAKGMLCVAYRPRKGMVLPAVAHDK